MTATTPAAAGRDRGTYGGMFAVAIAAAVLSFSALAGLAELAGVTAALPLPPGGRFRLAWLLPIAVDAYALTATRVWLRTPARPAPAATPAVTPSARSVSRSPATLPITRSRRRGSRRWRPSGPAG